MKIIKEDQNLMVLKNNNILGYIIGMMFILVGFFMVFKLYLTNGELQILAGLFAVFGVFTVFVIKVTTISLDKSSNKLFFLKRGLLGNNTKNYALDQIKEIELSREYIAGKTNAYSYHLAFIMNSAEIVPLSPESSQIIKVFFRQIVPEKTIGARVASFLGVPFQERRPPTVGEMLSSVTSAVQNSIQTEIEKRNNLN
jgi:hypothetical protein